MRNTNAAALPLHIVILPGSESSNVSSLLIIRPAQSRRKWRRRAHASVKGVGRAFCCPSLQSEYMLEGNDLYAGRRLATLLLLAVFQVLLLARSALLSTGNEPESTPLRFTPSLGALLLAAPSVSFLAIVRLDIQPHRTSHSPSKLSTSDNMSTEYRTTAASTDNCMGVVGESTMSKAPAYIDAHPTEEGSQGTATSTQMNAEDILNSTLAALENAQDGKTVAAKLRQNRCANVTFVNNHLNVLQAVQTAPLVCIDVEEIAECQSLTFEDGQGKRFVLTTDKAGTLTKAETCRTDLGPKSERPWWK